MPGDRSLPLGVAPHRMTERPGSQPRVPSGDAAHTRTRGHEPRKPRSWRLPALWWSRGHRSEAPQPVSISSPSCTSLILHTRKEPQLPCAAELDRFQLVRVLSYCRNFFRCEQDLTRPIANAGRDPTLLTPTP